MLRAVVEGLACELEQRLAWLTAAGLPVVRLTMCGSAAASRQTPQIVADVTQRPVACVDAFDVSALGAAVIARALVETRRIWPIWPMTGRRWAERFSPDGPEFGRLSTQTDEQISISGRFARVRSQNWTVELALT